MVGRSVSVRLSAGKRHAEWCGGKEGEESSPLVDAAFISRLRNPRSSDSRSTNRPCPRHRGRERGRDSTTLLETHRNRRKRPVDTPLPVQSRLLLLPQDTTILLADHFLRAAFNPCFRRWITRSFVTRWLTNIRARLCFVRDFLVMKRGNCSCWYKNVVQYLLGYV